MSVARSPFSGAPPPSWSAELVWVLDSAFSDSPSPTCGQPQLALSIARRLELSGRVAGRLGASACRAQLGDQAGRAFYEDFLTNVAVASMLIAARERVQRVASRRGIAAVWLKFAALELGGFSNVGSRVAADLDVLVEEATAPLLWRALIEEAGFIAYGARAHEHQLAALRDDSGAVIEVHTKLPGVRGRDGRFVRIGELERDGHVRKLEARGLRYAIPSAGLLAAHALAHGLLQNYAAPQSYSPLRMVADLADITAREPLALRQASPWLDGPVRALGSEEIQRVLSTLTTGTAQRHSTILLRHCLGARLNEAYAQQLRSRGWLSHPTEQPAWRSWALRGYWLVFPSSLELDAIYGAAASWRGRVLRRLRRPLHLLKKALDTRSRPR